jgi:hypothetical protein
MACRGNCRIASAFELEKQRSAAASSGSQAYCRCSRGDRMTGISRGTQTENTCSVLWVTPGAPVQQPDGLAIGLDTGFLEQLAGGGFQQRLVDAVERTGDRLPEAGPVGTLDQQDLEVGGVDDDEDGLGDFVGHDTIVASKKTPPVAGGVSVDRSGSLRDLMRP